MRGGGRVLGRRLVLLSLITELIINLPNRSDLGLEVNIDLFLCQSVRTAFPVFGFSLLQNHEVLRQRFAITIIFNDFGSASKLILPIDNKYHVRYNPAQYIKRAHVVIDSSIKK